MFTNIYHMIDNKLLNEDEEVILHLARVQYRNKNNGFNFLTDILEIF